ncbi:MAG TPA: flagellar hook-associated protein FlgL [Candidatus Dormibacteraeota bacterium]|nr:flagellar hook-associated protein FlgL [Candidatus Dormibacteraeota bacterium]
MRISTSEVFNQQTQAIDDLAAQQMQYGQQLSTGKQLNLPSDAPAEIGQDLLVRASQAYDQTVNSTLTTAQSQLSTLDGALSGLTSVLQSVRQIAVQGASETLSSSQRNDLATQVDNLLQQAIGIGNTQVGGVYVFAGTKQGGAPFQAVGSPVSSVTFTGNQQTVDQIFVNGQSYTVGVSAQQTFNLSSTDGSPDVFQTLINLRDALTGPTTIDKSAAQLNVAGSVISSATGISSAAFATPITADSTGNDSFQINGVTVTVNQATATVGSVLASINAVSGTTGVVATFDYKQERLILNSSSGQPFTVTDVASAGATGAAGDFVKAMGLAPQGSVGTELSTQIGDVDHVMNAMLTGRAAVGATLQALASVQTDNSATIVQNTQTISQIEDANVAAASTQFAQVQAALQAAYGTTTRLEQHTLFDYVQ